MASGLVARGAAPALVAFALSGAGAFAVAAAAARADRLVAQIAGVAREARAALGRAFAVAVAPEAAAADSIERMRTICAQLAQSAAPSVEAFAHAGRGARPVAVAAGAALGLGAIVPAPSSFASALARPLARAVA